MTDKVAAEVTNALLVLLDNIDSICFFLFCVQLLALSPLTLILFVWHPSPDLHCSSAMVFVGVEFPPVQFTPITATCQQLPGQRALLSKQTLHP